MGLGQIALHNNQQLQSVTEQQTSKVTIKGLPLLPFMQTVTEFRTQTALGGRMAHLILSQFATCLWCFKVEMWRHPGPASIPLPVSPTYLPTHSHTHTLLLGLHFTIFYTGYAEESLPRLGRPTNNPLMAAGRITSNERETIVTLATADIIISQRKVKLSVGEVSKCNPAIQDRT